MIKSQTGLFSMRNVFLWTTQPDRDGPFAVFPIVLKLPALDVHRCQALSRINNCCNWTRQKKTNRYSP